MDNKQLTEIRDRLLFEDLIELTPQEEEEFKKELLERLDKSLLSVRDLIDLMLGVKAKVDWDAFTDIQGAVKLVGREESVLRRAISSGKIKQGVDCYKFGKTWVLLKDNLLKIYKINQ